ncbi:flagellar basal body-associated FliL family protein [Algiphilus sp.]|uniref:flagellar basal body-associated FliL family protein n=1 Tax=Algiphilus sp. TaxID=1872431 RepID=UPI003C6AB243
MAEAAAQDDSKKGGGMMRTLIVGLLMAALGGGGGWYYLTQVAAHAETDGPAAPKLAEPIYWPFEPAFVVNLPDGAYMRYLKIDVALMTRDSAVPGALEKHAPLLRNELLMLMSTADYQNLLTRDGKEALRAQSLDAINARLAELEVAESAVEAIYFTNFVMQ